jgi:uncharacterized protein YlxP (DUF503 family)
MSDVRILDGANLSPRELEELEFSPPTLDDRQLIPRLIAEVREYRQIVGAEIRIEDAHSLRVFRITTISQLWRENQRLEDALATVRQEKYAAERLADRLADHIRKSNQLRRKALKKRKLRATPKPPKRKAH